MFGLIRRLRALVGHRQLETELDEELREHLSSRIEELVADGMTAGEAARRARLDLGNPHSWRESAVDAWGWRWLHDWTSDARVAIRRLAHRPAFTLTTVATLALGLGGNAAVFALAWQTSFQPLPYPRPAQLIRVFESNPSVNRPLSDASPASIVAWAERSAAVEALGFFGQSRIIFPSGDNSALARYQSVSPGVFAALGVRPLHGRIVLQDADRLPDEVLISYEYWQRRFGGDLGVINRLHNFEGLGDPPERIIGIMPAGFTVLEPADVWGINTIRRPVGRSARFARDDRVLARVREDHDLEDARADLARVSADLAKEFPDTHTGWTAVVQPLHGTVVGDFALVALLLVAGAAAVLFIACMNVGALLVMRASGRRQEIEMRRALGASSWRIVRLWMFEGIVVGLVSFAAGITFAHWLLAGLTSLAPSSLPRITQVSFSLAAIAVGLIGFICIVGVYALTPALSRLPVSRATRLNVGTGSRSVSTGWKARRFLLAAQAGLAVVLLTTAMLFASSLQRLYAEPLGFDPSGVVAVRLSPVYTSPRPSAEAAEFGRLLEERLRLYPGIAHASVSTAVPLDDGAAPVFLRVEGDAADQRWAVVEHSASPGFAGVLGISVVAGRWFDDQDTSPTAGLLSTMSFERVAVITESMAKALWPREPAVGKRLVRDGGSAQTSRVIGVIRDLKFAGAAEVPQFRVFVPWAQRPTGGSLVVLIKTAADWTAMATEVGSIANDLKPHTGLYPAITLEQLKHGTTGETRFAASLVGGFSVVALVLTTIGVFGAVAYAIAERRREFAVRMALGAGRGTLSASLVASGLLPILGGVVVGVATAAASATYIRALLFEVSPLSPAPYLAAAGTMLFVGLVASAAPLRRLFSIQLSDLLRVE